MSELTDKIIKQLEFIGIASHSYMYMNRPPMTGQNRVLSILSKEDGLIQSQLAEIIDIRPSSLAELLKKMEDNNLVTRSESEEDKRIKHVYLTDEGKAMAKGLSAEATESEMFFQGLSDEEKQQFSDILEKIPNGWDDEFKKQSDQFVNPMERLQRMQEFRNTTAHHHGFDWHEMSRDDKRKFREEMRKGNFGPGHGFRKDFRNDFWDDRNI
ncbi:MarR family winged helix-turn-helix transcriptional regulator [Companilactobacillus metriopterae]|uniref:MarR family winged helix-turn-helix transcriptional regulator n=1 Tax=Companilactobacillus metriopterae TaxID=1909267 RepID=UPI00100C0E5E|nr:MarR family transcriptional regulator [Companilactobacillus metriopterae]